MPFSTIFLLFWPISLALPSLFGSPSRYLYITLASITIIEAVLGQSGLIMRSRFRSGSYIFAIMITASFVSLISISVLRAPGYVAEGTAKLGLFSTLPLSFCVFYLLFAIPTDIEKVEARFKLLCLSIPLYVSIGLLTLMIFGGELAGMNEDGGAKNISELLSFIGVQIYRIETFPGMTGSNQIGGIATLGFLVSWISLRHTRWSVYPLKAMGWAFLIVSSVAVILLADSRAMFIFGILVVIATSTMSVRRLSVVAVALAFFSMSSAWIMNGFFRLLTDTPLAGVLTRQSAQGAALGVGTGRSDLWDAAFLVLTKFELSHLFGFGMLGQYASGISLSTVQNMFPEMSYYPTIHNTALQIIFDAGYLGVSLFFVTCLVFIRSVGRSSVGDKGLRKLSLALVMIFLLTGTTEVTVGTYNLYEFILFLAIVFYGCALLKAQVRSAVIDTVKTMFGEIQRS